MFRRFNPVLRLFAKRGSSGAPQSNARRTLVLAALMALALVNLTGEAAATSAGCTAFNNATLDSGSSNYTTARNTFQAGDTLHVDGPAGNSIFFNADSTVGYQPLPFNYNVQASDITSGTSSISGYFTFYYTDGPTTDITLSCVPAPAGRAQRISLSGLNQATTVTVGTPTSFSASSTSGLPVTVTIGSTNTANCTVAGSGGSYSFTANAAGLCTITASVAGNGSYDAFTDTSFINVTALGGGQAGTTPVLTGISPSTSVNGGETATITGSNLDNVTGILFGNKSLTVSAGNRAAGQITITIPAFSEAGTSRGSPIYVYAVAPGSGGSQLQSNGLPFNYSNTGISLVASSTSLSTTDTVDLTATVTPSDATGTVTFTATSTTGGAPITSTASLTGGQAVKTLGPFATGTYNVTATYNGDGAHNAVTSAPPIILTVAPPALQVSAIQSTVNLTVNSSASPPLTVVSASGGTGSYSYALHQNITLPLGLSLNSSGQLTGSPTVAFNGPITIDVTSGGVTQSASFTLVVGSATPTIRVSASKTSLSTTETTILTATVTPSAATGNVTFTVGSNTYGPVALSSGVATYTVGPLVAGTYSVAATYNGDSNYNSANGSLAGGLTVNAAPQTVTLSSISQTGNTGVAGTTTTFSARSTSGTQVSFSVDTGGICSIAPQSFTRGVGTYLLTYSNPGQCSLSTTVAGDGTYASFSANAFITVTVAAAGTPHLDAIDHIFTVAGGETATITGSNLDRVTSIRFGATNITPLTVAAGQLTFTVPPPPASVPPGGTAVQVSVVGSNGVVSNNSLTFTYYPQLTYSLPGTVNNSTISIGSPSTIDLGGASGGLGPYTYTITSNSDSTKITFPSSTSSNGQFSVSAPGTVGSSNIGVTVTDRSGQSANASFTLNAAYPPLQVTPVQSTVNLTVFSSASLPLTVVTASGGNGSYSYAPNRNTSLPLGLSLNSSGQLTGPPNATFNGTITIDVTSGGETKQASFTLVVGTVAPTISLSASKTRLSSTDTTTLTATVSPSTATGTVTFAVGSNTYGPVTLSSGVATYTVGPLSAGTYSATATYNGDDTYSSVTSASSSLSVAGPLSYSAPANIPQLTVGTQTTLHFGPPPRWCGPLYLHLHQHELQREPVVCA